MLYTNFAFLNLGTPELLLILLIALLLFGGQKLPQLSKSMAESIKELKKGLSSVADLHTEATSKTNDLNRSLAGAAKRHNQDSALDPKKISL